MGPRALMFRLTGDSWAPCTLAERSAACREAFGRVERRSGTVSSSSKSLGVRWLLRLTQGDPSVDGALLRLAERMAIDDPTPQRLNDLAVLLAVRGMEHADGELLLRALATLDRALEAGAGAAALFNRVLMLRLLGLSSSENEAFARYEALEREAGWVNDLRQLRSSVWVEALPEPTGILGNEWGRLRQSSGEKPRDPVRFAARWVAARSIPARDAFEKDFAKKAALLSTGSDQDRLASAVREFGLLRGDEPYSSCEERLDEVHEELQALGSPLSYYSALDQAICFFFNKDFRQSDRLLLEILEDPKAKPYLHLRARTLWILGLTRMVRGSFEQASENYILSLRLFLELKDVRSLAAVSSLLAKTAEYTGAKAVAWRYRLLALQLLPWVHDAERKFNILEECSEALLDGRSPEAAQDYFEEKLSVLSGTRGLEDLLVFAYLDHAELILDLGRPRTAQALLGRASRLAAHVSSNNPNLHRAMSRLQAISSFVDYLVATPDARAETFGGARDLLVSSIAALAGDGSGGSDEIAALRLRRRTAQLAQEHGDTDGAREILQAAIDVAQGQRERLSDAQSRHDLARVHRELFDTLFELEIETGQPWEALSTLEMYRANSLESGLKLGVEQFRQSATAILPHVDSVIYPHQTRTASYAIEVFSGGLISVRVGPPSPDLQALAALLLPQYLQDSTAGEPRLVGYVSHHLITVAPSSLLYPDGTQLIRRAVPFITPSLEIHRRRGDREHLPTPNAAPLFVADPATDEMLRLPRLPHSRIEADNLQALVGGRILVGEEATPDRLIQSLSTASQFHYSGHTLLGGLEPALALAGPNGRLEASRIAAMDLAALEVVVLSTCSAGRSEEALAVESLANAFLTAGARFVLAFLNPVNDEEAARTFVPLYERSVEESGPLQLSDLAAALRGNPNVALFARAADIHR